MIFLYLFTVVICCIIFDLCRRKNINDDVKNIPGPPVYPLIGNIFSVKMRSVEEAIGYIISFIENYGKIVRLWVYWKLVIIMTDVKALETLLASPKYLKKSVVYTLLRDWLGDGLLLSRGRKWYQRRKIITPAFHFKILEQFVEIFDEQSTVLVKCLRQNCGKGAFDINPYVTLATLDMIAETALGVQIKAQTNPNCDYAKAVHDMSNIFTAKILKPILAISSIANIFAPKLRKKQSQAIAILHSFTENIIKEHRASSLKSSSISRESEQDDFGSKRKMALLDMLMQATIDGKPLTNLEIREEVDTFTFEGHDTTTSGVSFALYCLSRNQDVQRKVFAEIREVIGDDIGRQVSLNDLNELKYLELVIKEALRLYPPVPIIGRMLEEEFHIDGSVIPIGTEIIIPLFTMFKDPKLFPNPDKFDPERFQTDRYNEKSNPYSYIPFSAGPRNCIGQKYAMLEMKAVISKILRHYELLPLGEDPKAVFNIVTRSTNGVNFGIVPRVYE